MVVFYNISTLIGYLKPNPVFTYISKLKIIWIRIGQDIELLKDINFTETLCTFQMLSNL